MTCPLCSQENSTLFDRDKLRSYLICNHCSLVFVPRSELISTSQELTRYEAHKNSAEDTAYLNYLKEIADAIEPHLPDVGVGLDYGCGTTKGLERIFLEKGYTVFSYDLFFHPEKTVLTRKYDFIILSEVIEHLRDPREELNKLKSILHPDGTLFIKTKLLPESKENFSNWFYKRDKTHIQFFSHESFKKVSEIFSFEEGIEVGADLFLFRNH